MSFLGRLLFPAAFRLADQATHHKYDAERLRGELDWAHIVDRAERLGVPVPVVQTIGELKQLLPLGIRVIEDTPGILRLAYSIQLKNIEEDREASAAEAAFKEAAVGLVHQACFVGVDEPDEYRYAINGLIEAYKVFRPESIKS